MCISHVANVHAMLSGAYPGKKMPFQSPPTPSTTSIVWYYNNMLCLRQRPARVKVHVQRRTMETLKDKVKPDSKGLAVIITNDYQGSSRYTELTGTVEDGNRLKRAFEKLGFAVHWEKNTSLETLQRLVWELRDLEYESVKDCKCITLVFSGHGVAGGELITQDGKSFDTCTQLISPILPGEARQIGGIPKIFLIDACRGDSKTETVKVPKIATGKGNAAEGDSELPRSKPEGDPVHQRKGGYEIPLQDLPKEGNFLVAYSTLPGCIANEYNGQLNGQLKGSLWLEIIARRVQEEDVSIEDLLTIVNEELHSKCQKEGYHYQQPEKLARLNNRLFLLRDHPTISTGRC